MLTLYIQRKDFSKIPGSPIVYWLSNVNIFNNKSFSDFFVSGGRIKTHNNDKYIRFFWEVSNRNPKWVPYLNGGSFRKYYGNEIHVIDWSDEARNYYDSHGGLSNPEFWDKEGITWTLVTSFSGFRIKRSSFQYSSGAPTIFGKIFRVIIRR